MPTISIFRRSSLIPYSAIREKLMTDCTSTVQSTEHSLPGSKTCLFSIFQFRIQLNANSFCTVFWVIVFYLILLLKPVKQMVVMTVRPEIRQITPSWGHLNVINTSENMLSGVSHQSFWPIPWLMHQKVQVTHFNPQQHTDRQTLTQMYVNFFPTIASENHLSCLSRQPFKDFKCLPMMPKNAV